MVSYTEHEAKEILGRFGIDVPPGIVSRVLPEEISLKFPVVLKVSDASILHKSDVGGVVAGIGDMETLRKRFDAMKARFPGSQFLVEEMAPRGVEFIIGVTRDPVFGKVIMLGTGGIYTELYHDVAFRKLPVNRKDAAGMLSEIKSGVFCSGFRGTRIDCELLEDVIVKVSGMVNSGEYDVESMDLNPVIVGEKSAVVADAKLLISAGIR